MINNPTQRIESREEVNYYLEKLVVALLHEKVIIQIQTNRFSERTKDEKYTNRFTLNALFPDEDVKEALKRELKSIRVENYVKTVVDRDYPTKLEFRVFGKYYDDDVYIKMRVEQEGQFKNNPLVFVISFHYAEHAFKNDHFPYKGEGENNEK